MAVKGKTRNRTSTSLPRRSPRHSGSLQRAEKDFAPRIGICAYDPFGNGKTVIHAYGGMFYNPDAFRIRPGHQHAGVPELQRERLPGVPGHIRMANPPLPAGTQNVSIFPQHPKDPYSTNWLFGIQQEIAQTRSDRELHGQQDHHMQAGRRLRGLELPIPRTRYAARPLSGFANENLDSDILNSTYNALQAQLRHNVGTPELRSELHLVA